jgi:endo-alpha-N-acetylgalactosaminidase
MPEAPLKAPGQMPEAPLKAPDQIKRWRPWKSATAARRLLGLAVGLALLGPLAAAWAQVPPPTNGCPVSQAAYPPTSGNLQVSASVVGPGSTVGISGQGLAPTSTVSVHLDSVPAGQSLTGILGTALSGADGGFSSTVIIPATTSPGRYTVTAVGSLPNTGCRLLSAAVTVVIPALAPGGSFTTFVLGLTLTRPGQTTTVSGSGCAATAPVTLSLDNGATPIGGATADDQGNFTATATIPSTSPAGQHSVLATCTDPNGANLVATAPLRVTGGLAVTGATFIPLAIVMVVTLAVGSILILIGRRRRNRYEP